MHEQLRKNYKMSDRNRMIFFSYNYLKTTNKLYELKNKTKLFCVLISSNNCHISSSFNKLFLTCKNEF